MSFLTTLHNAYRNNVGLGARAKVRDFLINKNKADPALFDLSFKPAKADAADVPQVPEWKQQGYRSEADWDRDNGVGMTDEAAGLSTQDYNPGVTPPNFTSSLTGTPPTTGGGKSSPFRQIYDGKTYNNPIDYANAIRMRAHDSFERVNKEIDAAYHNGLISFDERQQAIDHNRASIRSQYDDSIREWTNASAANQQGKTKSLNASSAYYSNLSPSAYQSGQADTEADINATAASNEADLNQTRQRNNESINQSLGTLDTQQGDLGRARSDFEDQTTQSRNDAKSNYQAGLDQVAQGQLEATAPTTGGVSASTQTYDPVQITQNFASQYLNALQTGLSQEQARNYLGNYANDFAKEAGVDRKLLESYLNYAYGLAEQQFAGN